MRKLKVIIFAIFVAITANAQSQGWTVYDTSNSGLPSNSIRAIAIEGNNKWISTYSNGLAKFDGTSWTVYDTSNSGLPCNYINAIAVQGSNIWMGTWGYGLVKFDGTNWTVYDTSNSGLLENVISALAIEGNNVWIGTSTSIWPYGFGFGGGLAKFDGTNWTVYNTSNSGLPGNIVNDFALATEGNNVWIGTRTFFSICGLTKFDGTNWTTYDTSNSGLPRNYVLALGVEGNNIWIGSGSLTKFDGTNWTVYDTSNSGLPAYGFGGALAVQGKNIWGGRGFYIVDSVIGLVKFDGTNWTVYNTLNSGLPSDTINALAVEGDNLWIVTDRGLAVYNTTGIEESKELRVESKELRVIKDKICLEAPKSINAELKIYDLCGRMKEILFSGTLNKGEYTFTSNIKKSGVYFVRLNAGSYKETKKLILIK